MLSIVLSLFVCWLLVGSCSIDTSSTISLPDKNSLVLADALSSDDVTAFVMDQDYKIWIGSSCGLNLYDGYRYHQFFHNDKDSLSIPDNQILCLLRDSQNRIWIGTENGLAEYVGHEGFRCYYHDTKDMYRVREIAETSEGKLLINTGNEVCELKQNLLVTKVQDIDGAFSIVSDSCGGFWIFSAFKSTYYDAKYRKKKEILNPLSANLVFSAKDEHHIWVTQSRAIMCIDIKTQEVKFQSKELIPILPNLLLPTKKGLLMKSDKHGLFYFNLKKARLDSVPDRTVWDLKNPELVSCLYKDDNENMWIGFHNGGFRFISETDRWTSIMNRQPLYDATLNKHIVALASTKEDIIWGGTNKDLFRYDMKQKEFCKFDQESIFTDSPYYRQTLQKIIPFKKRLWLLTNVRAVLAEYRNRNIQVVRSLNLGPFLGDCIGNEECCYVSADCNFLYSVHSDGKVDSIMVGHPLYNRNSKLLLLKNGKILLAMQGLHFMLFDVSNKRIYPLAINELPYSSNVLPTCLLEDERGYVWLGSNGHGLFCLNMEKKEIESIPSLPSQQVMSIAKDDEAVLWMGTRKGMMSYSLKTDLSYLYALRVDSEKSFTVFSQGCICSVGNKLFLGGSDGCVSISPSTMQQNVTSHLEIRKLCVRNEVSTRIALDKTGSNHYTFAYNENDLEINFGGVNFGDAPLFIYEYKMEGFDRNWIPAGSDHEVFYSNLPAGDYQFKVRAMQSYGSSVIEEKAISITVLRAPWLSIPALILYVCLCVGLIIYINWLYLRIRSNRMALQLANADKEREQRTNQMNMSFFSNISHEFRNPLTMIAGPIITLYNDSSLPSQVHRKLAVVQQSINSMLKLIDQMLDFNQLESDVLRLKVGQFDVVREINAWVDIFEETTHEHRISLEREGLDTPYYTWLDHDKLDKILGNLFTNALKHTPENGIIRISFSVMAEKEVMSGGFACPPNGGRDYFSIGIFNNGKHIPNEKLNEIFKRYYQVKELNEEHQYGWGAGIGLYYVKRLVQLHRGDIKVENKISGGVEFNFVIPSGEEAYVQDEHINEEKALPAFPIPLEKGLNSLEQRMNEENKLAQRPKILIVDDDTQLACYLRSIFYEDYQVENKYSAEAALAVVEQIAPDIILSDVIMGEMSGYEFCRIMKSDVTFSHIPFILITAKSQVSEQVEGLDLGANAYVTKPFDPDYLKALVRSQLVNCENMRKLLKENVHTLSIEGGLSTQDRIFMDELYQLMEKHLADLDLNLNTMCEELRMSRSKFNYKIKGLTGETPNNFFKNYKLNRAARLLKEGKNNVSEVAMLTGFGTVSYFSVCFKKQFGVNPSDYR